MENRNPQIYTETQKDGKLVTRYRLDKRYDPSSIEGRTGQRAAEQVGCRYDTVLIVANRIRELNNGVAPLIERKYGNRVTALQEIEQGLVGYELFGKTINKRRPRTEKVLDVK